MKFIRSKIDYFKNEIITYYEKDDGKIEKKINKFNKLLPYNYYDLKTEKFKISENIYTDLYETESDLYNDVYNKEFNYQFNF